MAKVPENAQELFNVQVPEALSKFPDKAREIGAVYLFKISGDGGGTWTVDLTANPPAVTQGDKGNVVTQRLGDLLPAPAVQPLLLPIKMWRCTKSTLLLTALSCRCAVACS